VEVLEAIPRDRRFTIQNGSNVKVGILFQQTEEWKHQNGKTESFMS